VKKGETIFQIISHDASNVEIEDNGKLLRLNTKSKRSKIYGIEYLKECPIVYGFKVPEELIDRHTEVQVNWKCELGKNSSLSVNPMSPNLKIKINEKIVNENPFCRPGGLGSVLAYQ
jgi:hypothetical protein